MKAYIKCKLPDAPKPTLPVKEAETAQWKKDAAIAELIGRQAKEAKKKRKRGRDIGANKKRGEGVSTRNKIIKLAQEGLSDEQIANKVGVTEKYAHRILLGVKNGKLDYDKVMELHSLGWKQTEIAEELGCSKQMVGKVIRWRKG